MLLCEGRPKLHTLVHPQNPPPPPPALPTASIQSQLATIQQQHARDLLRQRDELREEVDGTTHELQHARKHIVHLEHENASLEDQVKHLKRVVGEVRLRGCCL